MLKLSTVEAVYDDVILVLKGLSLEVPEGRIVALLGPNGAGKSTFIKCLLNLETPTTGAARVLGVDIRARNRVVARGRSPRR